MHEYRKFVEREMKRRGWRQRDLVQASGLSRAVVSKILRDDRDSLIKRPEEETIAALSQAFEVPREQVLSAVGISMGIPVSVEMNSIDISEVPLSSLMAELGRRATREQVMEKARTRLDTSAEAKTRGLSREEQRKIDDDIIEDLG